MTPSFTVCARAVVNPIAIQAVIAMIVASLMVHPPFGITVAQSNRHGNCARRVLRASVGVAAKRHLQVSGSAAMTARTGATLRNWRRVRTDARAANAEPLGSHSR